MAGYREFQTGEVLTAANVNGFLMEQATMTFADAAARDAALAGVLREGLLTYNLDTGALERYDGTAWVPAAPDVPGIGSNVVSVSKTDVFSTASTSFVDVTGMSVTITPSSTSSKLLVAYQYQSSNQTNQRGHFMIVTDGADNVLLQGDAAGLRQRAVTGTTHHVDVAAVHTHAAMFLLSPATDSPFTIKLRVRNPDGGGTFALNRSGLDTDSTNLGRFVSTMTVIEVQG